MAALQSGARIEALEGVRGLALLPVFAIHYVTLFGFLLGRKAETPAGWDYLAQAGVDLFFLLSGYLVYGLLLGRRMTPFAFLKRRWKRIYPAFLVVFALYLALSAMFPAMSKIPRGWADGGWYVLMNLLLLPGIFDIPPLNRVAWSLSYEVVFYTLLPVTAAVSGFAGWVARKRVMWIVGAGLVYWWACWWGGNWYIKAALLSPFGHPRLVLFLAGMVVREAHMAGWKLPGRAAWWAVWFGLALAGLCAAPGVNVRRQCLEAVLMAAGGGPLIYWAGLPGNWVAERLSWGGMRWLGKVSYSFYLLHGLVMHGMVYCVRALWDGGAGVVWYAVLIPLVFAAASGAAALLYAQVERRLSLAAR